MVGLLLVTHGGFGRELVATARAVLGELSLSTEMVDIQSGDDPQLRLDDTLAAARALDSGGGVLILADAFGATPCNLANRAGEDGHRRVISGLNLPMLLRLYNYPTLSLEAMVVSAVEAGRQGIICCAPHAEAEFLDD